MSARRVLAACALIALVALHFDYKLVAFPFLNREAFHRAFTAVPDRGWGEYPRFLEGVRAHTKAGDRIAVIVPGMRWDEGYSYAYYRASYFLAGRDVLPLITADGKAHMENFYGAQYVVVWHRPVHPRMGRVVWEGEGGALVKR